ncbi:MAG: thioesterase family protein [Pseudomonadota bacterium]
MTKDAAPQLIRTATQRVEPGWIDYNGHMNVAYYTMAFDRALDEVYEALGIGETAAREARQGPMALQSQIFYLAELVEGEAFHGLFQLLDADTKRVHIFCALIRERDEARAATYESLSINVDLAARRASPYPPQAQARIDAMLAGHCTLSRPEEAGRTIGIRRRG